MVAVIPSWLGENSHHFTGLNPWLVHIGRENVGTLVKLCLTQERYLQCIITRPDNLGDNTLRVTSNAFNDTFSIGRREEVLLDWNFVQCLQEYQIYKQLLLFDLAACTMWKEADAVNRGCFAFRLPIILARKQLTASLPCPIWDPYHHWRWQRIQWCYYQSMHTQRTE